MALAVPGIQALALAQLFWRRDEVEAGDEARRPRQGVAIGVVHFCGPRLRPFAQTWTEGPTLAR